jgi:type I restriction enzyme, S subunit
MQIKAGYKRTAVGIIPEEWDVRMCTDLSDRITVGIVIRPKQYYVNHGVPAFRSANIRESGITDNDLVFISEKSNALLKKSQAKAGDVLTVRTGYPGTSAVARPHHAGANCIDILITSPSRTKLDSDYLAIWVNSAFGKEQVLRNQGGNAQQHFNVSDMRNLLIALPTLPEQQAIAQTLSDVDALIAALDRLIAKKRDIKQATMQQLLTGKTRLPGFNGKWEVKQLGDVVQIKKGQLITSSTLKQGDIPVIAGGKQPAYYHASANRFGRTITISASGASAGYVALYNYPIFASDCSTISESESYSLDFIYYQLLSMQQTIYKSQTGGAQPHIHAKDLTPLTALVPSMPEQVAIAAVLSDMDAELFALEARRDKTRALKQGMMQELLTGKTRLI